MIRYRHEIDGIRALSIIFVILFHYFPEVFTGGYIGVDIFFVISGYLITSNIISELNLNNFSLVRFYSRRVKRLFPALLTVLVSILIFGWITLLPRELMNLGKHATSASLFFSNILNSMENTYFNQSSEVNPLLHMWSLSIEEQFYLIWPIILIVLFRYKSNFFIVTLLLLLCSFAANISITDQAGSNGFYNSLCRFWEILIGAMLSYQVSVLDSSKTLSRFQNEFLQKSLGFLGLASLFFILFIFDKKTIFPGFAALMPTLAAYCLIFSSHKDGFIKKVLSNKILRYVGILSYPLYLWHWPILSFSKIFSVSELSSIFKIACIILSFFLSFLTHEFIEKKFKSSVISYRKILTLIVGILIVALVGHIIFRLKGVPARLSKTISEFVSFSDSAAKYKKCFLEKTLSFIELPDECLAKDDGKKTHIWILGDSTANDLYYGLNRHLNNTHVFSVTTQGSCSPWMVDSRYSNCFENNKFFTQKVIALEPDFLVVRSITLFSELQKNFSWLMKTFGTLKTKIILIGPAPTWRIPLPAYAANLSMSNLLTRTTSDFIVDTVSPDYMPIDMVTLDLEAEKFSINFSEKITYISPISELCNLQGCKVFSPLDSRPLFYDRTHLTQSGSLYISKKIIDVIDRSK